MNESLDDDNIIFNKDKFPKIITITKERDNNNNIKENVIIINNGKNKIHFNKKEKINKEDIMNSLKKYKKIQFQNTDENIYDNNNNKSSINLSINNNNRISISHNNLKNLLKKEGQNENENNNINNKIKLKNIYHNNLNPVKINNMKNKFLKKEKNEIIKQNNLKFNSSELFSNNIFNNIYKNNNYNKQSDRISLRSSTNSNLKSESNFYNKDNYSDYKKKKNKDNIDKKLKVNTNMKDLTRNNTLNIDRRNSTYLITSILNMINTTKTHLSDKTQTFSSNEKCLICERNFSVINLCCSECNIHFFCRKCLKYYCRQLIEKGVKRMKCPITYCNYDIYDEFLKSILSEDYLQLLYKKSQSLKGEDIIKENISINKYELYNKKIKNNSEDKKRAIRLYNKKNVLDINSNIILFNSRKYKDEYCPKCYEQTLFLKTHTIFHKCLNCGFKICKYCNKEYTNNHLIINNPNHCKVYFRQKEEDIIKNNYCYIYIIQILFVMAMYYIAFAFCYLFIFKYLKKIIKINKKNENVLLLILIRIRDIICFLISIIFFIIIFPILFAWTPFFPIIVALFDGF